MKQIISLFKLTLAALVFVMLVAPQMAQAGCVYLKTLEAKISETNNVLSWTTMAETDNGFFLIERSNNGIDFEPAGRVQGAGTTIDKKDYSYTDLENKGLRVFYRLLQVDITGDVNITNTVLINRKSADSVFEITSMEGAVTDKFFNLNITSTKTGILEYRLQTRMGEVLQKGQLDVVKGENALSVDLSQSDVGTYQFSIRITNEIEVIALRKVAEPEKPGSILTNKEDKD